MEWTLYKDEPSLAKTVHGILIKTNQTKSWENTANVLVLVMIPDRSVFAELVCKRPKAFRAAAAN